MSIWTNGGKLVVDSSKKPIECETCPCGGASCDQECCNGGKWPDQINCDLGALGWTNGDCDVCDTLGGVYVLNYDNINSNPNNNCIWKYDSGELCTFSVSCSGTRTATARLIITARLSPTCNWSVLVEWRHAGLDDSCPEVNKIATYTISNSGGEDCDAMEIPIWFQNSSSTLSCIGSYPATIELSR
jgi:hypothetical protein